MKVSLITLGFCAFSLIFLKFSWIHCATNLDFSLLFEVYCTLALILAPLSPKDICKILKMAPYLWCEILTPTLLFVPSLLWHWIFFFFFLLDLCCLKIKLNCLIWPIQHTPNFHSSTYLPHSLLRVPKYLIIDLHWNPCCFLNISTLHMYSYSFYFSAWNLLKGPSKLIWIWELWIACSFFNIHVAFCICLYNRTQSYCITSDCPKRFIHFSP